MKVDIFPERYNWEDFMRAIKDPSLFVEEFDRLSKNIPQQIRFYLNHGSGVNIMKQDWDYLLILDACRYDIFRETSRLDGELKHIISKGSHSKEFCNANFSGKNFNDTVYVTANGYGARIAQNVFHDLIFTDEDDTIPDTDVLHSTAKGMAPSTVYDAAIDAKEKYPNKRIIVHFMQPHNPFLGSKAQEIRENLEQSGLVIRSCNAKKVKKYDIHDDLVMRTLIDAAEEGYISKAELREVYVENLEIVLKYIEDLISELPGRTVVTADHGNYLGEQDQFGHPKYEYVEELRKVPYLVVDSGERPEIIKEESGETRIDDEMIEQRLKDLGYK